MFAAIAITLCELPNKGATSAAAAVGSDADELMEQEQLELEVDERRRLLSTAMHKSSRVWQQNWTTYRAWQETFYFVGNNRETERER